MNLWKRTRKRRKKLALGLLFGIGCALSWHFIHGASETYTLSLTDPHFWFHLTVEGTIALYATGLFVIGWSLVNRLHTKVI